MSLMTPMRQFSLVSASQLAGVKREDVVGASDSKWIGSYAKAVVESGDSTGSHSDALNEYFRKNFRKLEYAQAMDVVSELATMEQDEPAACLDRQFWVWESLEEAIRPEVLEMSLEDFEKVHQVFSLNYKGT